MCSRVTGQGGSAADREIKLDPTPCAPLAARRFVSQHVKELGYPGLVEDAETVVSELVTNVVTHAPYSPLRVHISRAGPHLVLKVWDGSQEPPVRMCPDFMAEGGRGLHIVDEMSVAWGYNTFPGGKVIWARLGKSDRRSEKRESNERNAAS
jgi:anti-sigma regulatory factor (Ser/Thr protein kinase)